MNSVSLRPLAGLGWAVAAVAALPTGCTREHGAREPYFVAEAGLTLARLPGWRQDPKIRVDDPAKGGIVFRLSREGGIAGSPRVDVVLEPLRTEPSRLDGFLTRNLREMAKMERKGLIRIRGVEQQPVQVGPRRAYRVRHEYVFAQGGTAITQISLFVVLNGRGVTVTAAGQTELFKPLTEIVEEILESVSTPPAAAPRAQPLSDR